MHNKSNTDKSAIKIFVKSAKTRQPLKEIKATKEFKYTPEFIKNYIKPGNYIRFSNETDKDTFMLTPNFSKYSHTHTPVGIYGYPLDSNEVVDKLLNQRLFFQNNDLIIIYHVDPSNITRIEELAKKHPDFLEKLKLKFGEEQVKQAVQLAYKKDKEGYGNIFRYPLEKSDPLLFDSYSTSALSRIYWTILKQVAKSSEQTSFLYGLGIKALDDRSSTIDTGGEFAQSQAPEQGLVFSTKYITNYELFTNPARKIKRKNSSGSQDKILQTNIQKFVNAFKEFKESKMNLKSISGVELTPTSTGVQLKFETPESVKKLFIKNFPNKPLPQTEKLKAALLFAFDMKSGSFVDNAPQIHFDHNEDVKIGEENDSFIITINLKEENTPIERMSLYKFFYFLMNKMIESFGKKSSINMFNKKILTYLSSSEKR